MPLNLVCIHVITISLIMLKFHLFVLQNHSEKYSTFLGFELVIGTRDSEYK